MNQVSVLWRSHTYATRSYLETVDATRRHVPTESSVHGMTTIAEDLLLTGKESDFDGGPLTLCFMYEGVELGVISR